MKGQRDEHTDDDAVRADSWLWAARFFKTRSLAKQAIEGGKVTLDDDRIKPAKEVKVGQRLQVRKGDELFCVDIVRLARQRGPASVARTLYRETTESIERRESARARRRMERAGLTVPSTKPSKKQRRDLRRLKSAGEGDND